jgi:hypothetical protein
MCSASGRTTAARDPVRISPQCEQDESDQIGLSSLLIMPRYAAQRGPSVAVRGRPWKTSGYTDRATAPDAVRYASVDTATPWSTVQQGDTRRDKGETPR